MTKRVYKKKNAAFWATRKTSKINNFATKLQNTGTNYAPNTTTYKASSNMTLPYIKAMRDVLDFFESRI